MGCVPFDPDFSCCDEWFSLDQPLRERSTDLAWSTLRALTGGQVGNCPVTVRPCLTRPCGVCGSWSTPPGSVSRPRPPSPTPVDEVFVGADKPVDVAAELWFDPDADPNAPVAIPVPANAAGRGRSGSSSGSVDEVYVGAQKPVDPDAELWFDPDANPASPVPIPVPANPSSRRAAPQRVRPPVSAAPMGKSHAPGQPWMTPYLHAGEWHNLACGGPECSCAPLCEIVMPGQIAAILQVLLDGCEQPLEDFRVDNGYRIVRTDGYCWPSCQDMGRDLGEPGTLGITYLPGILPDTAALWAAGVLACEFSKACSGAKCRLPSSVSSISRQGVTMTMSMGMWEGGLTGIREVDAYITSVNPNALRMPSTVWSPDVPWAKHRYETPTARVTP